MSEFSIHTAHKTPTSFSDDLKTPFNDIGMGEWSDDQLWEFFEAKTILDVGSGFEGIARRLYGLFGDASVSPKVINLNPQFTDWQMRDDYDNGQRRSSRQYKQTDIEAAIREVMEMNGEDYEGYFAQRTAIAGLVQQLPLKNEAIDILTSTWGFPTCLYDRGERDPYYVAGYREIQRVLNSDGGVALLAPVRLGEFRHTNDMLKSTLHDNASYDLKPTGERWGGQEFVLELTKS